MLLVYCCWFAAWTLHAFCLSAAAFLLSAAASLLLVCSRLSSLLLVCCCLSAVAATDLVCCWFVAESAAAGLLPLRLWASPWLLACSSYLLARSLACLLGRLLRLPACPAVPWLHPGLPAPCLLICFLVCLLVCLFACLFTCWRFWFIYTSRISRF